MTARGRSPGRATPVPPPRLQRHPWSRWLNRRLAPHADAPALRGCRKAAEAVTAALHSENHDPRTNGEYELIRRLAPGLSVAVDVGANRGDWTVEVVRCAPDARVVCSELASPTRQRLRNRMAGLPQVCVLDCGLGDAAVEVEVKHYPSEDRWTSCFDYPHPAPAVSLRESVRRADDELARLGIEQVDLLKVDAEGSDYAVLAGCSGLLERGAIGVVQFEYGFACVLARVFLLDFYELLGDAGYLLGRLGRDGFHREPYRLESENFFGPNFVAVHSGRDDLLAAVQAPPRRGRRPPGRSIGGEP